MTKNTCKSAKQDGSPCKGQGLEQFDGYCIAHGPADQNRERRAGGGKASATPATAARADKRIPERLQGVINALTEGMIQVQEGTLSPAAYSSMCKGAKELREYHRLADEEMEQIRAEETQAAASEIAAQQNQDSSQAPVEQVLAEPEPTDEEDEPAENVLTDQGKRPLDYRRHTTDTQKDIDGLRNLVVHTFLTDSKLPEVLESLTEMRAAIKETLADLQNPAPPLNPLTGQPLKELPARVQTGLPPVAKPAGAEPSRETLDDQLSQVDMLISHFKETYGEKLSQEEMNQLLAGDNPTSAGDDPTSAGEVRT